MLRIWSDDARYGRWRNVEIAYVVAAFGEDRELISAVQEVSQTRPPSREEVSQQERITAHDVVAFVRAWTAPMGSTARKLVHFGLTSSDVVDTGQALAVRDAQDLIFRAATRLRASLVKHALRHQTTIRAARTHGRVAAPDFWGHRIGDFAHAVDRSLERATQAANYCKTAVISGPVGTYAGTSRLVEIDVARQLSLAPASSSTQIVARDSLAAWVYALSNLASVCEAIATEIRLGQQSGVDELFEGKRLNQKGSSSMPHKRNPVRAENICGLARTMRGYSMPMLESVASWNSRDLSNSSVERIVLPDASSITEYVLSSTAELIDGLEVDRVRMQANLSATMFEAASHHILQQLLLKGMDRAAAEDAVQRCVSTTPPAAGNTALLSALFDETGVHLTSENIAGDAVKAAQQGLCDSQYWERLRLLTISDETLRL